MSTDPNLNTWVRVAVEAEECAADGLSNFLLDLGAGGIETRTGQVIASFDGTADESRLTADLAGYVQNLVGLGFPVGKTQIDRLPLEDWSQGWKVYFKPVRAGSRFVIKPPWEPWTAEAGEMVIDINPALAFGTGTHETTRLCITLLEESLRPGDTVLDAGTGSGVLAIAAKKLGAGACLGFDVDADALGNARENLGLNGLSGAIDLVCGRLETLVPRPYDVICANINRRVLETLIPSLWPFVHAGTQVLVSGLLETDRPLMEPLFQNAGWVMDKVLQEGEWMGYRLVPGRRPLS